MAWLACQLEQFELETFDLEPGDPAGQAVWEFLAILVGLRTWWDRSSRAKRRCNAHVSSDSMAALQAARRLRSSCPRLNTVAAEMALLEALDIATIDILSHMPGVANTLADQLSRMLMPGSAKTVPPLLERVTRTPTEKRDSSWWKRVPTAPRPAHPLHSLSRPAPP